MPGTPQRWPVIDPFLLGRKVDPGIAWAHWSQLILTLSERLAHPDMAAGPARLPDLEATRERLQAASKLLRELAQRVELVPAEDAAPGRG